MGPLNVDVLFLSHAQGKCSQFETLCNSLAFFQPLFRPLAPTKTPRIPLSIPELLPGLKENKVGLFISTSNWIIALISEKNYF